MAVTTHCLVTDPVGAGELRANTAFPGGGAVKIPVGSKRGVVVLLHHLNAGGVGVPFPLTDIGSTILYLTLANDLVTDGWVVIFPVELGDTWSGIGSQTNGLDFDFVNDTNHGSRLLTNTGHWWDGALQYINTTFGNWPIVPFGVSWGGWVSLSVAISRASTIAAYGGHVASTLPWTISGGVIFSGTPNVNYTLASSMNTLTLPQASITVNEVITGASSGPASLCVTSNAGAQICTYTGVNTGTKTFTGGTGGSGTLSTNGAVLQSSFTSGADISYTALNALGNGQQGTVPPGFIGWETADTTVGYSNQQLLYDTAHTAGAPLTSYAVSGGAHGLSSADVTAIMAWFTGTVDPLCPAVH